MERAQRVELGVETSLPGSVEGLVCLSTPPQYGDIFCFGLYAPPVRLKSGLVQLVYQQFGIGGPIFENQDTKGQGHQYLPCSY